MSEQALSSTEGASEPKHRLWLLVLLTALTAIGPMATDLYLPSLTDIGADLSATPASVQLTISLYLVGFALAQLIYGPLSDRFGRRPVLIGGMALFTATSLLCALSQTIEQLIVLRILQATGACSGPVLARAVIRDLYDRERAAQALSYLSSAMALAPVLAPAMAGVATEIWGWRSSFYILLVWGVLVCAATILALPETNVRPDKHATRLGPLLLNYFRLLRHRSFVLYTLTGSFAYAGLFAFISGSAFVLMELAGMSAAVYGIAFGMTAGAFMLGALLSARLTRRIGIDAMLMSATSVAVLSALTGVILVLSGAPVALAALLPQLGFMMALGCILPNAMAGAVAPFPHMAGTASGMLGCLQMFAGASAGIMVGQFYDDTAMPMQATLLGAAGLSFGAALLLRVRGAAKGQASACDL